MTGIAFLGALELGLIYAFVALGVYLTFRVLDFPDLTVDGTFPLGAAVAAVLILGGWNPWLATLAAAVAGALAGLVTAFVTVRFRILHLLAGILTMIALFSINLRIMGRPNVAVLSQETVFTIGSQFPEHLARPAVMALLVIAFVAVLWWILSSEWGLALRATGGNPRMARSLGVGVNRHIMAGVAGSNALVGIAGALFAQANGFADVTAGLGTIVVGLAAVIIGETLIGTRSLLVALVSCVFGSILYRLAVQFVLAADIPGVQASDLSLATSVLVLAALVLPKLRRARTA